jgi:hypothetical protein
MKERKLMVVHNICEDISCLDVHVVWWLFFIWITKDLKTHGFLYGTLKDMKGLGFLCLNEGY